MLTCVSVCNYTFACATFGALENFLSNIVQLNKNLVNEFLLFQIDGNQHFWGRNKIGHGQKWADTRYGFRLILHFLGDHSYIT